MSDTNKTSSTQYKATHPADITEKSVRSLIHEERIGDVKISAHGSDTIARGFVEAIKVSDDITITRGRLAGQRGYDAEIANVPGLNIEVRFSGKSKSVEQPDRRRIIMVQAGDVLIAGSKEASMWTVTSKPQSLFEAVSVHFNTGFFETLRKREPDIAAWALHLISTNTSMTLPASTNLNSLTYRLLEAKLKGNGLYLKAEAIALEVLLATWPLSSQPTKEQRQSAETIDIIEHAKALIQANPRADLTVESLASACRISQSHLKTLFRNRLGKSIGLEIRTARMTAAGRMLRDGVPIANAANILGYKSPEAFSRAVKQHFGHPPSGLRKS